MTIRRRLPNLMQTRCVIWLKTAFKKTLVGVLLFGILSPVLSAEEAEAGNISIQDLNWTAYMALRQAQRVGGNRAKSLNLMQPVREAILRDGAVDPVERLLLETLSEPSSEAEILEVTSQSPSGASVSIHFVNLLNEDARELMRETLALNDPIAIRLAGLWDVTRDGDNAAIFREFLVDKESQSALSVFLEAEAGSAWDASSKNRTLRHFQEFVATSVGRIRLGKPQLSEEEQRTALVILHDAVDRFATGIPEGSRRPPAYLYSFIATVEPRVPAEDEGHSAHEEEW